jgi:hypothetical protein
MKKWGYLKYAGTYRIASHVPQHRQTMGLKILVLGMFNLVYMEISFLLYPCHPKLLLSFIYFLSTVQ